jgi:hypothetical protein
MPLTRKYQSARHFLRQWSSAINVIRETELEPAKIEKKTQGLIDTAGDK